DRRDTDDFVGHGQRLPEDRPRAERLLLARIWFRRTHLHWRVVRAGVNHHLRALSFRGGFDTALGETGLGILDRVVGHDDLAGARFTTEANDRADDFRIRGRAER